MLKSESLMIKRRIFFINFLVKYTDDLTVAFRKAKKCYSKNLPDCWVVVVVVTVVLDVVLLVVVVIVVSDFSGVKI